MYSCDLRLAKFFQLFSRPADERREIYHQDRPRNLELPQAGSSPVDNKLAHDPVSLVPSHYVSRAVRPTRCLPELVGLLAQTHSRFPCYAFVNMSRSLARGTMMIAAGYCVSD
jgi:hypothetical protein